MDKMRMTAMMKATPASSNNQDAWVWVRYHDNQSLPGGIARQTTSKSTRTAPIAVYTDHIVPKVRCTHAPICCSFWIKVAFAVKSICSQHRRIVRQ